MKKNNAVLPYLALGFGILVLGFSAIFVRWANAPGPVVGFLRIGLATVVLTPVFVRRSRSSLKAGLAVLALPVLGGLFSAFDHAIWNTAIRYTSATNATLLNYTAPLWVALAAWLWMKERMNARFWLGLAMTLAGAAAVLGSDFLRHPTLGWGDLMALGSGVFYAGYFLFTQRGRQYLDTLPYTWFAGASSALALLGMCLALRLPLTGYPAQTYLAITGAALVSQIGGYLSISYALGHLPASVVSPTMIGQPVMTALLAIGLLGERLTPAQWLGGLVVLAGIYLVHVARADMAAPGEAAPGEAAPGKAAPGKAEAGSRAGVAEERSL